MAYGTLNAGAITPGSGNTLTISETVSLTGNATLGGTANALGTVTSGNLSNTAIVHRSGASLQTKGDSFSPSTNYTISTTASRLLSTNLEIEMTCASTANNLHIQLFIPDYANIGYISRALHTGFKYSINNWSSELSLGRVYTNSHYGYFSVAMDVLLGVSTSLWVQVPSTTTLKIQPYFQAITGDVRIFNNSSTSSFNVASLIVTEVQA